MKKLLYLLVMALPLAFVSTSCNDDDDLPNVELNVSFSGGQFVEGTLFVVQGDTISIDSITITNLEKNKAAAITSATYYWDAVCLGTSIVHPFKFQIVTSESTPIGEHLLQIETPILAVDKSAAIGVVNYNVQVVADSLDIPGTPDNDPIVTVPSLTVK
jgi:hypothetical protein